MLEAIITRIRSGIPIYIIMASKIIRSYRGSMEVADAYSAIGRTELQRPTLRFSAGRLICSMTFAGFTHLPPKRERGRIHIQQTELLSGIASFGVKC